MTVLRVPVATYRLQFNRDFRFEHARALVPYLQALGITDLYASPLFQTRRGSTHGYDVTDPTRLNPELGTPEEFEFLVEELKRHGMGLLLDIVPNHMAASHENPWWTDVLENGPGSRYAPYFDIDWYPAEGMVANKVLLPILGGPYDSVLENREIVLGLDEGGFHIRYADFRLPLGPASYGAILAHRLRTMEETLGSAHPAFRALIDLIDAIHRLSADTAADRVRIDERHRQKEAIKDRLWHLYLAHAEVKTFVDDNVRIFNGIKGDPRSLDLLDELLTNQAYRLGFWRVAREEMNYRRFFDVSDLVGVRVEDPQVFESTHALVLELIKAGKVTGLRADHIDGLYDPMGYLRRLQSRIGPFYLLVEKILIGDETLPAEWPVHGTTGYEFLNAVNGVFVDQHGTKMLDSVYGRFTGVDMDFHDVVVDRKRQVMEELFPGEVRTLGQRLSRLATQDRQARDLPPQMLSRALVAIAACLPVYRTYIRDFEAPLRDRPFVERAVKEATRRNPSIGTAVFEFLRRVLLLEFPSSLTIEQKEAWLCFVKRWQQFTGPITAKGLEDTSLYVYNRLISLNEVGGDPGAQNLSVEAFHRHHSAMRTLWPYTMNATSTHDTKRSEDVRARLNMLSELPQAWARCLRSWSRWNRSKKRYVGGRPVPDPNEEILIYQTLIGAWPLQKTEVPAFKERLKAYVIKAAREARVHTSWIDPDPEYERALVGFVKAILKPSHRNTFLPEFLHFQGRIAFYGAFNALAQVLLKMASPGVPDFYQGTELWDFSLVDPDNRHPVDFATRRRLLEELDRRETADRKRLMTDLLSRWDDGRLKLYLTAKALRVRRSQRDLFLEGEYLPLSASGKRREHVCAFARRKGASWAVVAVPRLLTKLIKPGVLPVGGRVWGDGRLVLPQGAPGRWFNVLTDEATEVSFAMGRKILPLKSTFRHFPVALLSGVTT